MRVCVYVCGGESKAPGPPFYLKTQFPAPLWLILAPFGLRRLPVESAEFHLQKNSRIRTRRQVGSCVCVSVRVLVLEGSSAWDAEVSAPLGSLNSSFSDVWAFFACFIFLGVPWKSVSAYISPN